MPSEDYQATLGEDDRRGAEFSDDGEYRYRLWRTWNEELPMLAFVMLNPSTADAATLDPTCRRCKGYAESWGYGTLVVANLFALRATDPDELYEHDDPIGPKNDEYLEAICADANLVVGAWGHHGDLLERAAEVAQSIDVDWHCLDETQAGHPVHPLYQPADLNPRPWDASRLEADDAEVDAP